MEARNSTSTSFYRDSRMVSAVAMKERDAIEHILNNATIITLQRHSFVISSIFSPAFFHSPSISRVVLESRRADSTWSCPLTLIAVLPAPEGHITDLPVGCIRRERRCPCRLKKPWPLSKASEYDRHGRKRRLQPEYLATLEGGSQGAIRVVHPQSFCSHWVNEFGFLRKASI